MDSESVQVIHPSQESPSSDKGNGKPLEQLDFPYVPSSIGNNNRGDIM